MATSMAWKSLTLLVVLLLPLIHATTVLPVDDSIDQIPDHEKEAFQIGVESIADVYGSSKVWEDLKGDSAVVRKWMGNENVDGAAQEISLPKTNRGLCKKICKKLCKKGCKVCKVLSGDAEDYCYDKCKDKCKDYCKKKC